MILERSSRVVAARRQKQQFAAELDRQVQEKYAHNPQAGPKRTYPQNEGGWGGFPGLGENKQPSSGVRSRQHRVTMPEPVRVPETQPHRQQQQPPAWMQAAPAAPGYPYGGGSGGGGGGGADGDYLRQFQPPKPRQEFLQGKQLERNLFDGQHVGAGLQSKAEAERFRQHFNGPANVELTEDDKMKYAVEKSRQKQYMEDLNEQVRLKRERQAREKKEKEERERREEKEMMEYNPWGKGGAGAPLRSVDGSIITDLRQAVPRNPGDGSPVRNHTPVAPRQDAPEFRHQRQQYQPQPQRGFGAPETPRASNNGGGDSNHTRFQFNALSPERQQEMVSKQNKKLSYQEELRAQIEAKKRRKKAEEEREKELDRRDMERIAREQEELGKEPKSPGKAGGNGADSSDNSGNGTGNGNGNGNGSEASGGFQRTPPRVRELSPLRRSEAPSKRSGFLPDSRRRSGAGSPTARLMAEFAPSQQPEPRMSARRQQLPSGAGINFSALAAQPIFNNHHPVQPVNPASMVGNNQLLQLKHEWEGATESIKEQLREQQLLIRELRAQVHVATRERDAVSQFHSALMSQPQISPAAALLPATAAMPAAAPGSPMRALQAAVAAVSPPPAPSPKKLPTTSLGISTMWGEAEAAMEAQAAASAAAADVYTSGQRTPRPLAAPASPASFKPAPELVAASRRRASMEGSLMSKSEFVFDGGVSVKQPPRTRRSNSLGAAGLQLLSSGMSTTVAEESRHKGPAPVAGLGALGGALGAELNSITEAETAEAQARKRRQADAGRDILQRHMPGKQRAAARHEKVLSSYLSQESTSAATRPDQLDSLLSDFVHKPGAW